VTITEITLPGNSRLETHADDEADDNFKRGQSPKPAPSTLEAVAEDELLGDEDFLAKLKSIGEPDEAKWWRRDENGRLI